MEATFLREGALVAGEYFLGHYEWDYAVMIGTARMRVRPGRVEPTVVELEIGGVLSGFQMVIPAFANSYGAAGPGTIMEIEVLGSSVLAVVAGAELRWKVVSYAGEAADAATVASIVLDVSSTNFVYPEAQMEVRWVKGDERLKLFDYLPGSHTFVEAAAGVSTGRSIFSNVGPDTSFAISIEGIIIFTVTSLGVLQAGYLDNSGTPRDGSLARIEFWRMGADGFWGRWGWVAADGGVGGNAFKEGTPPGSGFVFYGGGVASVELAASGWIMRGGVVATG